MLQIYDAIDTSSVPKAVKVDKETRPLMPESFIDWLEPRLTKQMRVFEWGSGNGSLWLSRRVGFLVSVEHHVHWRNAIRPILPANSRLIYIPLSSLDQYPTFIRHFHRKLDLIIVDGMERDKCITEAVNHLASNGVLILDNSDSEAFEGQAWLREQGFSEKVFHGQYRWAKNGEVHATTTFFKEGNCLGV